jgi:hypothetical protein
MDGTPRMHAVSNRLLQIQVSAPLVEYRSNVARVLETSVVATQENICSVGVDGKLIIFMHQDDLLKDILVGYCSHLSFRQLKRLYKARAAVRPRCLKVASVLLPFASEAIHRSSRRKENYWV